MTTGEILLTAGSAIGATTGAGEVATILNQTGTVNVPSVIITIVNCIILFVNTGIAIYKKIKALKAEEKKEVADKEDKKQ